MRKKLPYYFLTILIVIGALIPFGSIIYSWYEIEQYIDTPVEIETTRGFDWIQWEDRDGQIEATYVFPNGTGHNAGIQKGDRISSLNGLLLFSADDLKQSIEGISINDEAYYEILRETQVLYVSVVITPYPLFLYPIGGSLWQASVWGFSIIAFLHLIALGIIIPLGIKTVKRQFSIAIIVASSVWVLTMLIRIIMLIILGPVNTVEGNLVSFQFLSILGLLGWNTFPAFLLNRTIISRNTLVEHIQNFRFVLYLPAIIFSILTLYLAFFEAIGPISFKTIFPSFLYYGCFYVAMSTGLYFFLPRTLTTETVSTDLPIWNRAGSLLISVLALLLSFLILNGIKVLSFLELSDLQLGWIIVFAQLFPIAPIILISQATLKYGNVNTVISQGLAYALGLGIVFFSYIGLTTFIEPYLVDSNVSNVIVIAFLVVFLTFFFERFHKTIRRYFKRLFAFEKQKRLQYVLQFRDKLFSFVSTETLLETCLESVQKSFQIKRGAIFLADDSGKASHIVQSDIDIDSEFVSDIFNFMPNEHKIWALDPELSEVQVSTQVSEKLSKYGLKVWIPLVRNKQVLGYLLLGDRTEKPPTYTVEEIDFLKSLTAQLVLAMERISLIEREKMLVQQHAEAQLVALRAQINPHFLFNALNTIAALIDEQPEKAEENIERLATIFRYTLRTSSQTFVPLADELSLIGNYLSIEEARFGHNLLVEQNVEKATLPHQIPAFSIQTLVENAIKHGLEKKKKRGKIGIETKYNHKKELVIKITDTGNGIPRLFGQPPKKGKLTFFGTGLSNVAERLEALYHRKDLLSYSSSPDGTTVTLIIPT